MLPTSSLAKTGQSENNAFTIDTIPAGYLYIVIFIVLFDIFRNLCADKLATPTAEGIQVTKIFIFYLLLFEVPTCITGVQVATPLVQLGLISKHFSNIVNGWFITHV